MDTLVVQIGVKHGRVAELARSHDARLSVGRGYNNDLVLTDQHVAPRQLEFRRKGDQWHMLVLDHTNRVLLNSKKISIDSTSVNSGDQVTIGRTRLSLYSAEHPVEHTRKLVLSNWLALENTGLVIHILVLLGVSLFDVSISLSAGYADEGGKQKLTPSDGVAKGIVEGGGARLTIGGSVRSSGECRFAGLEGKFDLGTFVDPGGSKRAGLMLDIPDMDKFQEVMASEAAAEAMSFDGVHADTLVMLVES